MKKLNRLDERNKEIIFEISSQFTECISDRNNTQTNNTKYIDIVISMYNLIGYTNSYSRT